ncbi:MAG TPA: RHS repeat-associated core domain-containing protein [Anaerolineae bacterium]|nr:RHS repeat-associated core domain-containing protein [Anaerolineae bacterium]
MTDLYWYNALGQRMRDRLAGVYSRYVYNGDRVLEEYNDSYSGMRARYTTESGSYYQPWVHNWRTVYGHMFPLFDGIGTARHVATSTGTITDSYTLEAFGGVQSTSGTTPNPYRFGGAWGYITDPSGFLQLGARYYWPEIGRFISQDPIGEGGNWYAYVEDNPVRLVDPAGEAGLIPPDHVVCTKGKIKGKVHCDCPWPIGDIDVPIDITFDGCKEVCATPPELIGPLAPQTITGSFESGPAKCTYTLTTTGEAYHCKPKPPPGKPPKPK